jgi:hypothetical protein
MTRSGPCRCDGHHEMSDLGAICGSVHSGGERVELRVAAPALVRVAWRGANVMTAIAKVAEINEAFRELAAEHLDRIAGGWPGSNWVWGTTTTGISGESTGRSHPSSIEIGTA